MSIFGILLIVFLIYFVVWPIVKVWLSISRARKQARDFFGTGAQRSQRYGYGNPGAPNPAPKPKRKKIDPNVGEYVDFEEISTYTSEESSNQESSEIKYQVESQIEDAVWEEIK